MTTIYQSLAAIMNEVEAIGKNKKNAQQGFMYRGIDDLYNDLQPKFAKHKVFIASEVLEIMREERQTKSGGSLTYTILKVKFTFYAEDGSNVSSVMVGEAMDSGDKGSNKAMSIALKYCLFQLLLIPTEEVKESDPDATIHQVQAKTPVKANTAPPSGPVTIADLLTEIGKCKTVKDTVALYNKHQAQFDGNEDLKAALGAKRDLLKQPA